MNICTKQRLLKLFCWISLLCLCIGIENCSLSHHSTHDDLFTAEDLLVAQADQLQATVIFPHIEIPLEPGKNVLWCGSFQLAWNEACSLLGEALHFSDDPPMVKSLNKQLFTGDSLDHDSFVALAGFIRDNIHQRIQEQLRQTFQGKASPKYIPSFEQVARPQDIVAYAYLFKNLQFPVPFERLETPLIFQGAKVSCFGIGEEYKSEQERMYSQVSIIDYRHADDFIIELKTTSTTDVLILAKVHPENTLAHLITTIQQRIAQSSSPIPAEPGDVLSVPKFNVDITRRYHELEKRVLVVENPDVPPDAVIVSALQNIRFQMNEEGVKLRSEAHIAIGCAAPYQPSLRYRMVFDQPFLLMLKQIDADVPYFALWVDNPELLTRQ